MRHYHCRSYPGAPKMIAQIHSEQSTLYTSEFWWPKYSTVLYSTVHTYTHTVVCSTQSEGVPTHGRSVHWSSNCAERGSSGELRNAPRRPRQNTQDFQKVCAWIFDFDNIWHKGLPIPQTQIAGVESSCDLQVTRYDLRMRPPPNSPYRFRKLWRQISWKLRSAAQ